MHLFARAVPLSIDIYTLGSTLIGVGLVSNCGFLAQRLVAGDLVSSAESQVLSQLLIFLVLVFGFTFQQIGRIQARHDADKKAEAERAAAAEKARADDERAKEDRRIRDRNDAMAVELNRLRIENLENQVKAGHAQILASLEDTRESTDKTVTEAIRIAAAIVPPETPAPRAS